MVSLRSTITCEFSENGGLDGISGERPRGRPRFHGESSSCVFRFFEIVLSNLSNRNYDCRHPNSQQTGIPEESLESSIADDDSEVSFSRKPTFRFLRFPVVMTQEYYPLENMVSSETPENGNSRNGAGRQRHG